MSKFKTYSSLFLVISWLLIAVIYLITKQPCSYLMTFVLCLNLALLNYEVYLYDKRK
jgi:hypothetical protein